MAFSDTLEQLQNIDLSDVDRIGVWPIVVRAALWLVAFVLIFVITYFLFIKDLTQTLETAERQEIQLRQSFETKASEANYLEDYRAQMVTLEEQLQGLIARLPTETEQPELLVDIEDKAQESGLEDIVRSFGQAKAGEIYEEKAIQITAKGSYHDFGTFVSGLAGMPRIVTVHDFRLASPTNAGSLNITLTAKTYRYVSKEK